MECFYKILSPSPFGTLKILWKYKEQKPKIHRIYFPIEHLHNDTLYCENLGKVTLKSCQVISALSTQIHRFLEGSAVDFDLRILALEQCSEFQRRVLLAEYGIPRGWVSTYGRIARHLVVPGGARAVGNALANNPFPIIIPCHRAIRSNGGLGGYRGGIEMKRKLLEMEGISFSASGKAITDRIFY